MTNNIYPIISKAEAKEKGLKYYFTGKPCKHGHIAQRYVNDGACIECRNERGREYGHDYYNANKERRSEYYNANKAHKLEYMREYHENNKAHKREYMHEYHENNKERLGEYRREYRENNKEHFSEYNREYAKKNPHKFVEYSRLRSTRLYRAIPGWYEEDLVKLIYKKRDELNELWGINLEVDHIIPISPKDKSVCGLHCWNNLQLLDKSLNGSKHDSYQTDW